MMNMPRPEMPQIDSIKHIHMIAICGTAMGALASILKKIGYRVTGSDKNVYPPMSDFLNSQGISIFQGFEATNLDECPDLVIVGNAVSKDNVEAMAMMEKEIPFCSMPEAINLFVAANKGRIVVTGTHGKTTTSSFLAWLLQTAGLDPSFLIGGILNNFNSNFRLGKGNWVVLEGDEYDTAFFDKGPKFLHYGPTFAIITSIEFDHADIFRDLDHVKQAFDQLIGIMEPESTLIVYDNDANIQDLLKHHPRSTISYGHLTNSDWRLGNITVDSPFTRFEVYYHDKLFGTFKTRMIGEHNLLNLVSGLAIGYELGMTQETMAEALAGFKGVRRRQEVRGIVNDIVVIDDFAHHPTAVKATTEAVKAFYSNRRLVSVFEPRTNSSRRQVFQHVYPECFDAADLICIRQAPMLEKIPPDQRFSSRQLVENLFDRGLDAYFFEDTDAILSFLSHQTKSGDVVLIMSNGGFDNIHQRLLEQL